MYGRPLHIQLIQNFVAYGWNSCLKESSCLIQHVKLLKSYIVLLSSIPGQLVGVCRCWYAITYFICPMHPNTGLKLDHR